MSSETIDMELYLQLFSGLIQVHMNKEQYNLFMQKINERTMMKDPNFRWCIQVSLLIMYNILEDLKVKVT